MAFLEVHELCANIDGKEILNNLTISDREGRSSCDYGSQWFRKKHFCQYYYGSSEVPQVTYGRILVSNESILNLKTDERAKKGLFLGFQYPTEVSGVGYSHFLRNAYNTLDKSLRTAQKGYEKYFLQSGNFMNI